jgi:hypothetical protein
MCYPQGLENLYYDSSAYYVSRRVLAVRVVWQYVEIGKVARLGF